MHADDNRLYMALIAYFRRLGYMVGDNEPYDHRIARGGAVNRHAGTRRLPHTMVEYRNDLISNEKALQAIARLFYFPPFFF